MSRDSSITWRIHCAAPRSKVFRFLTTSEGRQAFWAESATEADGIIHFIFPNGQTYAARILKSTGSEEFSIGYFDTVVTFTLEDSQTGGTILTMKNTGVPQGEDVEVRAGWVSVLLSLKAAVDFGIDLRNHHPERSWDQGFVDN